MQICGIKTAVVFPGDELFSFLAKSLPVLNERTILAITSKVVSTCLGRIMLKKTIDEYTLIQQEADAYLPKDCAVYGKHLTIKHQRIIPSAGVDQSNIHDAYVLHPENPQQNAEQIWHFLRMHYQLEQLGVIITDSALTPLRMGVTGVCIGWCGFEPLYDYVGTEDIFQQTLNMTRINLLDALAASAALVMGEGNEQIPLALIQDAPKIDFQNVAPSAEQKQSIFIDPDLDLFAPLIKIQKWRWR